MQCSKSKIISLDYVSAIREVLFKTSLADLKKTQEDYKKKCPGPINQIFPDKMAKSDAVTRYEQRKSLQTELEPAGKGNCKQAFIYHTTK